MRRDCDIFVEYTEIYCNSCRKVLGRYNVKYFTDDRMGEVMRSSHSSHVREGHDIEFRRVYA